MRVRTKSMSSRSSSGPPSTPRRELDYGLDLLAHVLVGDADDRDVEDLRVHGQTVLDLLRVDVRAAGDDHEGLAVGEVQVAVLVDVAEVPHGRPGRVLRVLRLTRLLRVVVVAERHL